MVAIKITLKIKSYICQKFRTELVHEREKCMCKLISILVRYLKFISLSLFSSKTRFMLHIIVAKNDKLSVL